MRLNLSLFFKNQHRISTLLKIKFNSKRFCIISIEMPVFL